MEELTLQIEGMHCASCVRHVTKALSGVEGLQVQRVEVGEARVSVGPDSASRDEIAQALSDAGFSLRNA